MDQGLIDVMFEYLWNHFSMICVGLLFLAYKYALLYVEIR